MNENRLRRVTALDLDQCYEIECNSYPGDEAATKEKIRQRIREYPEGFIVLERQGRVIGFINCGATDHVDLADEAFKDLVGHDPNGHHIVVFSVVVHPDYQGQGFAGVLISYFIAAVKAMGKSSIQLICKSRLVGFYEKYGFEYIGASESSHGGQRWHEMVLYL